MNFYQIKIALVLTAFFWLFAGNAVTASETMQSVPITGKVIDAQGESLPGVNVVVKGTTIGVISGSNGSYSITVPNREAVLVFSFVGFASQEIAVGNRQVIDVTLLEDAARIEEVVVVGYGVQKRSQLTGAMAAIGESKLRTETTPRVENMLSGKVPGVFVASGTGQPGSTAAIVIRGKSTVNGSTAPLWVIDGVIVGSGTTDMNPADIESITVLKDAASTAIYGSQGTNGVIVVTTKKGRAGTPVVNFSAQGGVNTLHNGNVKVMDGKELYDFYNSFGNRENLASLNWWSEDLKNRNFDWWDNATRTGYTQDYNISVSGGNDRLTSFTSLGYYTETGAVKGYEFTRLSGRASFNYQLNDRISIRPSFSLTKRDIDDRQHSTTAMYQMLPWDSPYKKDGKTLVDLGSNGDPVWIGPANRTNYMYDLQWNYSQSVNYELMSGIDFTVKLTDWLTFESVNNYKMGDYKGLSYTDPRSTSGRGTRGSLRNSFRSYDRIYTNQLLRVNRTFGGKHHLNGLIAYEWNEYNGRENAGRVESIPAGAQIADLGSIPAQVEGKRSDWAVQSFFGNFNYAYSNRYVFQGMLRSDGASNFGSKNRYGVFFSIGGAWNIHEEEFFQGVRNIVNSLRPRISYGSTGNRPSSLYPSYTIYGTSMSNSYNGVPGAFMSTLAGNDKMTWETTYTTNAGIDASFFGHRLNLSIDAYWKNTSGLLFQTPLPSVWGVTSVWRNVGELRNQGLEITIDGDIIRTTDMRWNVEAHIGLNRNKIHDLYRKDPETGKSVPIVRGDGLGIAGSANTILEVGYDMDTWYVAEWAGVNPDDGTPQWYTTNAVSGERELTTKHNAADNYRVHMGAYTPKFFGGFNTSFLYKGFDFNAVFSYSVGGKIYNYSRLEYDSDGAYMDRNQMKLMKGWSRWEKPGDIATHPQPRMSGNNSAHNVSSRYLEDGSYLKMKAISAGYTLPFDLKHVSNIRFYVSGENLLTITGYSGVNPEISPNSDGAVIGSTSPSVYPSVKRVVFGVNVKF